MMLKPLGPCEAAMRMKSSIWESSRSPWALSIINFYWSSVESRWRRPAISC